MSIDAVNQRLANVHRRLSKADLPAHPVDLFGVWYGEAVDHEHVLEPGAMTLATATTDGQPSARLVLMRTYDPRGFCFYTNYESRKAMEIAANPQVAAVFWWGVLQRQIRIEGAIERLSTEESDAYFVSRPRESCLAAIASPQSEVIASRAVLEARLAALQAHYAEIEPPRPPFWGGYRIVPQLMEFWQGGPHRLHDRLRYTKQQDDSWRIDRLAP